MGEGKVLEKVIITPTPRLLLCSSEYRTHCEAATVTQGSRERCSRKFRPATQGMWVLGAEVGELMVIVVKSVSAKGMIDIMECIL